MASATDSEVAVKLAASPPPQLRIVGFAATTTTGSASDSTSETCCTSPRAVPESPLSRLLRSATWPTLRVRLCKSEIPAGSPSVQDVSRAVAAGKGPSDASNGRSTSPISIPRVYSCSLMPAWGNTDAVSLHMRRSDADGSAVQRSLASQQLSYSPMSCSNTDQGASDMDFAAACWTLD